MVYYEYELELNEINESIFNNRLRVCIESLEEVKEVCI